MYRYVCIIWNPQDPTAGQRADQLARHLADSRVDWNCLCRMPGMLVLAPRLTHGFARILTLQDGRGVLLGQIFPAHADQWRPGWQPDAANAVASRRLGSDSSSLVQDFWGQYVAFLSTPDSDAAHVIRDCSGAVPCYITSNRDVTIVFSEISDLDVLDLPEFEIDREYLSAFIYSPELQINRCAIRGVTELLAGQRLQCKHGSHSISHLWDPRAIVRSGPIESLDASRSALRSTTEWCIAAWASRFSDIVLSLSGGLDSAIVLGCLSRMLNRPNVVCVNRFHEVPGEDEREYARRAASLAGIEILERQWCSTHRVMGRELLAAVPRSPKPYIPLPFALLDADSFSDIVDSAHAQAIWTGEGGDHIFFNIPTALGAADYMQDHGLLSRDIVSAIRDAARFSRKPYSEVLRKGLLLNHSRARWKSTLGPWRTGGKPVSFLQYDALPPAVEEYVMHPWLSHGEGLPKGKQLQIELLAELLNRNRIFPASPQAREHHPLISQPLLELSLRIPLYFLTTGGRQRGLARQAFRDIVPAEILAREDKGSTSLFWIRKIRERQAFLRDLLLDGWLATQGLIDRASLEPYLVAGQPIRTEQWSPLAACIAAEMWVRSWISGRAAITHLPAPHSCHAAGAGMRL